MTNANLLRLAQSVGIDADITARDLQSGRFEDRVYEDFMSGVRSGVNGTPTFFINGVRFDDSWDADTLTNALRAAAASRTSESR